MKYGNLNFLEPSGPSGPVTGLLYLYCLNKAQNADLLGKDMVDEHKTCIRKYI